jgi:hypothetical protein
MSKHERISELAKQYAGHGVDPRYAGYFALFNEQKFYEAHDILEDLWLADKRGLDGDFFKGLIQLAGAFVHLQKNRPRPAAAVFKLARHNLGKYPAWHRQLDTSVVQQLISVWLIRLENDNSENCLLNTFSAPHLQLLPARF